MCECTIIDCRQVALQTEFKRLTELKGGKEAVYDWLAEIISGDPEIEIVSDVEEVVISEFEKLGFHSLATKEGFDFIASKFSCPQPLRVLIVKR